MKHIVISAVNIRKGGTLTILHSCLDYLSAEATAGRLKVTALVHSADLCRRDGIDFIEMPDTIRGWTRRLWAEYVTMNRISKRMQPVDLWFSLHDTTPRVKARRQAVYCQTSFPFLRWRWRDFRMDFKIPLFAMLTRFAYRINVHRNHALIVQQQWLRDGVAKMLGVDASRFIVAPPRRDSDLPDVAPRRFDIPTFLFAATADCHKNFETIVRAAAILEKEIGHGRFKVILTISGNENRYAGWIARLCEGVTSVRLEGLMDRPRLFATYAGVSCMIFPSRIESWGLPISEFINFRKPMILADLPYARETAAGAPLVAFFDPDDPRQLSSLMRGIIDSDLSRFKTAPDIEHTDIATSWHEIFDRILY